MYEPAHPHFSISIIGRVLNFLGEMGRWVNIGLVFKYVDISFSMASKSSLHYDK